MDPHSRLSQFNQRAPKAGPMPQSRYPDLSQLKPSLEGFGKRPSARKSSPAPSLLVRRPIASNSRVKQDEKYRKDMHLAFVNNALQQKAAGICEPFDELVGQFSPKSSTQTAQLRLWILALSHVVSRLERTHASLVEAIVSMPWTTMDNATVKSYTVFVGMLLSARPEYLSLILGKIAQGFTHQSGIQALDTNTPESSSSPLTRRVVYDRLHYLLKHLISVIPTLSSTLLPLLVRHFPHKRQNQTSQTTYIRNLLRVSSYCPELADRILATIVDRAIQIDVEIQVELEELEEDQVGQDQDMFDIDPFDTAVGEGDDSDSDSDSDSADGNLSDLSSDAGDMDRPDVKSDIQHIQEMVKKLDAILMIIFEHFHRTQSNSSLIFASHSSSTPAAYLPPLPPLSPKLAPLSSPVLELSSPSLPETPSSLEFRTPPTPVPLPTSLHTQFQSLLSIFDRIILPTFKSRYTQFLLFFYTSLSPDFADIFQGLLVDRALFQPESTPVVTRAAAAAYIGSFVSRAQFVDREGVRRVVAVLCEFLKAHLDGVEEILRIGSMSAGGAEQNGVFYAVLQTVFLIFCFRWRDLLKDEQDEDEELRGSGKSAKKWMPEMGVIQRAVTSVLNPLKICAQNVVMQFARIAHATDFVYCYTVLESNKRSDYGSNTERRVGRQTISTLPVLLGNGIHAELNTFFPFDPYKLPKSSVYIEGIYREWESVAIDDDDDDDEEGDEDDTGDDEKEPSSRGSLDIPLTQSKEDDGGLGVSLGAMSISPVRPGMSVLVG